MPADALAALETWISQQPGYSASLASLSEFYALHPLFKTELKGRLCQVIDASPTTILAVDNSRIFQRVAILITTISDLQVRLGSVRGSPVIALDTEGFAEDGVSLLQIGWPGGLPLLIDLDAMKGEAEEVARLLRHFFSSDSIKLIHDCHEDARLLTRQFQMEPPARLVDCQIVHEYKTMATTSVDFHLGFAALLKKYGAPQSMVHTLKSEMKVDMRKTQGLFTRRPLTAAQIRYAADDVRLLLEAWQHGTLGVDGEVLDMLNAASTRRWASAARASFIARMEISTLGVLLKYGVMSGARR